MRDGIGAQVGRHFGPDLRHVEQLAYRGVPPTIGRLKEILKRRWKPENVRYITQFAAAVEECEPTLIRTPASFSTVATKASAPAAPLLNVTDDMPMTR